MQSQSSTGRIAHQDMIKKMKKKIDSNQEILSQNQAEWFQNNLA
jgi:hypothetical protein